MALLQESARAPAPDAAGVTFTATGLACAAAAAGNAGAASPASARDRWRAGASRQVRAPAPARRRRSSRTRRGCHWPPTRGGRCRSPGTVDRARPGDPAAHAERPAVADVRAAPPRRRTGEDGLRSSEAHGDVEPGRSTRAPATHLRSLRTPIPPASRRAGPGCQWNQSLSVSFACSSDNPGNPGPEKVSPGMVSSPWPTLPRVS